MSESVGAVGGRAAVPSNDEFDAFGERGMHYRTPEKRRCDECGHTGTDGGSKSESYCGGCGETVPYPKEDLCPSCGMTNCMLIACPVCGGHYSLDDDEGDDVEASNASFSGSDAAGGRSAGSDS